MNKLNAQESAVSSNLEKNKQTIQELKDEKGAQEQKDEKDSQEPVYTSSVVVPEGSLNENQENQELTKYAVISQEEAKTAALKEVQGNLNKVYLEDEDGNVVYSVEIFTPTGVKDVKVDAGNGHVLAIENENSNEVNGQEVDGED
jgi:uncharacterized membrane protein YkoI